MDDNYSLSGQVATKLKAYGMLRDLKNINVLLVDALAAACSTRIIWSRI